MYIHVLVFISSL